MERRILNAFPRIIKIGDKWFSQVIIEATALPRKIEIHPNTIETDMPGSDKDPGLFVTLEGLGLAMAPDSILVTDGLIRTVSIGDAEENHYADHFAKESTYADPKTHVKFVLEHPVMPEVTWHRPSVDGDEKISWPYAIEFTFPRDALYRLFSDTRIAIDPGHGGRDAGVKGPVSLLEKNVAMEISQILYSLLSDSGAKVFLSRERDDYLSQEERSQWAKSLEADVLVRIHVSGSSDPLCQEYHLRAKNGCSDSHLLASDIQDSLEERLGIHFQSIDTMEVDPSLPPAIQVEPLCLSHFVDEANFRAPLFKKRIAQAIYNGLARYFKKRDLVSWGKENLAPLSAARQEISFELAPPLHDPPSGSRLLGEWRVLEDLSAGRGWDEATLLRVRTHLITEKDSIVDIVKKYTKGVAVKGDLVGISESVVAITQGRAIPPDKIRPSVLAKVLSRFAHPDASVSAVRSMQKAIEIAGVPRILLAAAAGLFGKFFNIHGLFFRVAGHEVAEIDDSGGTMPPYDRHVILGPEDPMGVARNIWKKTGLWALILDTNDKGAVDILGSSFSLSKEREDFVKAVLKKNPFGNDDQKTPLVVIKVR